MDVMGRSRGRRQSRQDPGVRPRFVCPFFRHDPTSKRLSRSCRKPGFQEIYRLNEHLKKVHYEVKEITADQLAKIHSLPRTQKPSAKWRIIYEILFPDDDRVPPPFSPSHQELQMAAESPHPQLMASWKKKVNINGFHVLEEETKDDILRFCSVMISPFIDAVNEVGLLRMDTSGTTSSPPLAGISDSIQRLAGLVHENQATLPPCTSPGPPEPGAST